MYGMWLFVSRSVGLPVASGRGGREGKKNTDSLSGGLTASDKKRLVAEYGDLSNDEDDLYQPTSPCVQL